MNTGRTVFAQLMDFVPMYEFRRCVERYRGNYKVKSFSCLDQFLSMAFAQLTYRESLRDIEACLRAVKPRLYHMGIRGTVSRTTLAHANKTRDWRIYRDFAQVLMQTARRAYQDEEFGIELNQAAYALDSTIIDLCLSLFPWAWFQHQGHAVKLHALLDLRGNIPSCIWVTTAKVHDVNLLDQVIPEPGSFYIMDRGYLDFTRLYVLTRCSAFFVIRAKRNIQFRRLYSHPVDTSTGLRCDQTIALTGMFTPEYYPEKLRRIRYVDREQGHDLTFFTNNFTLSALTIALLYKCRWQAELFFKWIKQHLRIKAFYGTTETAVKTQIWIAISVYVLVAIVRKQLRLEMSLYTILQILSVTAFEKAPLAQVLTEFADTEIHSDSCKQLTFFEL